MEPMVIFTNDREIKSQLQRLIEKLPSIDRFVKTYQREAEGVEELPKLTTELLPQFLFNPESVRTIYQRNLKPVVINGVTLNPDAIKREEPNLDRIIQEAKEAYGKFRINIPATAFAIEDGKAVVSESHKEGIVNRYSTTIKTEKEKELWETLLAMKKTYQDTLDLVNQPTDRMFETRHLFQLANSNNVDYYLNDNHLHELFIHLRSRLEPKVTHRVRRAASV